MMTLLYNLLYSEGDTDIQNDKHSLLSETLTSYSEHELIQSQLTVDQLGSGVHSFCHLFTLRLALSASSL